MTNLANRLKNNVGSLSVEASIIFAVLAVMILGVSDLSRTLINKERLERLSYSYASLVREKRFYKDAKFIKEDGELLYKSAQNIFKGYIKDIENLGMVIEIMAFEKGNEKKMKEIEKFVFGKDCETDEFKDKAELSFQNVDSSWTELNRVSVCLEEKSLLNPAASVINLNASSIAVSRR